MSQSLGRYNPDWTQDLKDRYFVESFDKLDAKMNLTGSQLIAQVANQDQASTNGQDYQSIPGFQKAFVSSPSVLDISASFAVSMDTAGQYGSIGLHVDGVLVASKTAGYGNSVLSFAYKTQLQAGNHSVDFRYKTMAGTLTINPSLGGLSQSSEMSVTEHMTPDAGRAAAKGSPGPGTNFIHQAGGPG